jgi:hypothetical protein
MILQLLLNAPLNSQQYDRLYNGTHEFDLRTIALIESKYSDFLFSNGIGNMISTNIMK